MAAILYLLLIILRAWWLLIPAIYCFVQFRKYKKILPDKFPDINPEKFRKWKNAKIYSYEILLYTNSAAFICHVIGDFYLNTREPLFFIMWFIGWLIGLTAGAFFGSKAAKLIKLTPRVAC